MTPAPPASGRIELSSTTPASPRQRPRQWHGQFSAEGKRATGPPDVSTERDELRLRAVHLFGDLKRTADVCVVLVWPGRKNKCGRQLKALLTHVVARKAGRGHTHTDTFLMQSPRMFSCCSSATTFLRLLVHGRIKSRVSVRSFASSAVDVCRDLLQLI